VAAPAQENPVVIRISGGSKRFVIRKDKSLKERIVNFGRSRRHREDFWALREIDLEIRAGSTVGLIGANGSGKSTLLKLIGGIIQPTTGSVERRGRLAALLELGAGFHPDLTGRDNVFLNASILGLSREQTEEYFDSIVEFSEIGEFIDTQVKFYSSGMYVRLAFAIAVHVDPDVLLVDEVLAVGDEPFQRKCMDRIKEFQREGRTIILVTHSLAQVGELCDRAVVLDHGALVFDGDPGTAIQVLRSGFDERLPPPEETTDDSLQIVDVVVEPDEIVETGQDLAIRVTARSTVEVRDWQVSMDIQTPLGQLVFGTNTQVLAVEMPPLDGVGQVVFRLPDVRLLQGQYTVGVSLGTFTRGEVQRLSNATRFTVDGSGGNFGVVALEASCEVSTVGGGPERPIAGQP
jgi:ABC-2 type transport system ATP-binding protein